MSVIFSASAASAQLLLSTWEQALAQSRSPAIFGAPSEAPNSSEQTKAPAASAILFGGEANFLTAMDFEQAAASTLTALDLTA